MIKRYILAAVILFLALGIGAPYVEADRYGHQIRDALQRNLNRRVEIGDVRFNLFTGPGFTVKNVVIYDDPSAGIEPFAHMLELEARISLRTLWTRRLDFSMLRFVSPSVNIVKPDSGTWNILRLAQDARTGGSVPEIQVTGGRIYLKTGDTKSAFYIANADVTIAPRPDSLRISFEGEPARTDRNARSTGLFRASGTLSGGSLDLDLELDNSPVDELGGLLRGRRLEYHGTVSSRAKIRGPLANLTVSGSFNLADVHRWDLMTEHDRAWTVNYKGRVDVANQRIDLATVDNPNKLRLAVTDLMKEPQWSVDATVTELPAAMLLSVARDMGAPVPLGVNIDGRVFGVVGFASRTGLGGQLNIGDGSVKLREGPELKLADTSLVIAGDSIQLKRTALVGDEGQGAQFEGEYNFVTRVLDATISGQGLRLLSRAAVPVVNRFQGGKWSAELRYHQADDTPAVWTGSFDVRDTTTRAPGIAAPIRINTARIDVDGAKLRVRQMRALIGDVEVYGSYRYNPADTHPDQFDFTVPKATLAELEALLAPALRRDEGFFARTLRLRRAAIPEWLQHRRAEGLIRVGALTAGDASLRAVRSRVVWEGGAVQLSALQGRLDDGLFRGTGTVDITKSEPQYKLRGIVHNIAWQNGMVDFDGELETLGSGLNLFLNLRGEGAFHARGIALAPEQIVRSANGLFNLSITRSGPQFKLSEVQASLGSERFTGDGTTLADGRLQMELASANRIVRVNLDAAR